jgi:hypothetical protein
MRKICRFGLMLLVATLAAPLARVHTQQPDAERALPNLSREMHKYYMEHPEEFQRFLESLPPVSHELVPGRQLEPGEEPVAGSWTSLTNPSAFNMSNPLLLTDGTVIAHRSCTNLWYKFTPSNTGSYINGTWAPIASTVAGYMPRFFGSAVLPDGRVVIEGGEYNGCSAVWGTQGAIYDPVANTWTPIAPPAGWTTIGDATGIVLSNGTYMQTDCCDSPPKAALLNPSTLTWTATGTGKFDVYDEESIALLHDDTLLTADAYVFIGSCGTGSERYNNATGAWTSAGSTIIKQSDCDGGQNTFEVGPIVQRYDGTAVSFSGRTNGAPQTAIYNTTTHTWAAGPVLPSFGGVQYTMADAPAAVLPNGNVLLAMSPSNWTAGNHFPAPTHYWELNTDNTWTQAPDKVDFASFNSYQGNFVLLPTGQVMATSIDGPTVQIYTPSGTFQNAWRPTISSVPTILAPGQTITISGTQLNGLTQGTYYGDDTNADTNFPLVRITDTSSGHVTYARTFNHSTRSIAPGVASSTSVKLPATLDLGSGTLEVVANGIPSLPVNITVSTGAAEITTPTPGSTIGGTVNFGWTAGTGASQYWLYVGSTGVGSFNVYNSSTGTTQSATVTGVPTTGTIYVRLWTLLSTGWVFNDYTYTGGAVAAVLTTPPPGSTISGTVTFGWTSGVAASQYWLYVGTAGVGSFNIYSSSTGTSQTATVAGVPATGTIYVRLWTLLPAGWTVHDYTYVGGSLAADLTTPPPGSTISGTVTFGWTSGIGASQYWLYVGTAGIGSFNIYNSSTGTAQFATVAGVPASGTIYVRLWTLLPAGWTFHDYTYVGGVLTAAAITMPTPGTTLYGSSATFAWNAGIGISQYWLYVGTTGVGSNNTYSSSTGTTQSAFVTGLPTSGTIYVRLWSLAFNGWRFRDYTYTGGVAQPSVLTTPLPGTMLSGSTEVFRWSSGQGASQYWLYVGTTGVGSANIYTASQGTNLSATVGSIPTSGTIYVRLWTLLPTGWTWSDYTYSGGLAAALTMPPPGTILSGSAVTFDWSSVTGATQYWLYVGTTGVGSLNVYSSSTGLATSAGVTGIPTSGTIYVRVWTLNGSWRWNDYTYTGGGAAAMQTPIPGSTLSSSTTTFGWNAGTGVDQYWLYFGTTGVGSANIYTASQGTALSVTVNGLPTSDTVYVRLWTHLASGWVWNDYRYTARGAAELQYPDPGTTLSGSTVTFNWDDGNGATQYWLYVGTTGVGSLNIHSASTGTLQWATVSGIPTSGTVYVRVWTYIPAIGWQINDYTYTGGPVVAAAEAVGAPQ